MFKYVIAAVLLLSACDGDGTTINRVNTTDTEDTTDTSPLCIPCVGPHISLMDGQFKMFDMGPGISLY